MKKDFDFDNIGKRMPYRTPDGFFDEMESDVWKEIQRESAASSKRRKFRPYIIAGTLAVAAGVALMFVLRPFSADDGTMDGFYRVEQAFADLSPEDQAYMLEVYKEDIFMNE